MRHSRSAQRRPWRSLQQQLLGLGAAVGQRGLEPLRHGAAQFALVAAMGGGERLEVGGDGAPVDQLGRSRGAGARARRAWRFRAASEAMGTSG